MYAHTAPASDTNPPAIQVTRSRKRLIVAALVLAALVLSAAVLFWLEHHRPAAAPNPVPAVVRAGVPFPVYYPAAGKLPAGYTLDASSFSAGNQAVVYRVSYGAGKQITFSVQQKPSASDIQSFYKTHLPLHNDVATSVGTAAVGVLNNQVFVSLPTHDDSAWLLATAPLDIDQAKLKQVLEALQKPAK